MGDELVGQLLKRVHLQEQQGFAFEIFRIYFVINLRRKIGPALQPGHQLIRKPPHGLGIFAFDHNDHAVKIPEAFAVLLVQHMELHILGDQILTAGIELEVRYGEPQTENRQSQGDRNHPPGMVIGQRPKRGKHPVQQPGRRCRGGFVLGSRGVHKRLKDESPVPARSFGRPGKTQYNR